MKNILFYILAGFSIVSLSVEAQVSGSAFLAESNPGSQTGYGSRGFSPANAPIPCSNDIYSALKGEGVYLSAADFTTGKISFVNNQVNKKYRFRSDGFFNSSSLEIITDGRVFRLNKDSIFGYRDKKNTCYRFFNKTRYKVINPAEKILLYSRISWTGGPKNSHPVTNYFFSENAGAPLYRLTKWNLKQVFFNNVSFNELLDVYFQMDSDLTSYDSKNKIYRLNRVYDISKQAICKMDNYKPE